MNQIEKGLNIAIKGMQNIYDQECPKGISINEYQKGRSDLALEICDLLLEVEKISGIKAENLK